VLIKIVLIAQGVLTISVPHHEGTLPEQCPISAVTIRFYGSSSGKIGYVHSTTNGMLHLFNFESSRSSSLTCIERLEVPSCNIYHATDMHALRWEFRHLARIPSAVKMSDMQQNGNLDFLLKLISGPEVTDHMIHAFLAPGLDLWLKVYWVFSISICLP
jgi:hypothetical protein